MDDDDWTNHGSISDVLADVHDARMCDNLNSRIVDHYGNDTPLTEFTVPERIVNCVVLAKGIIGNGGFQYLFESNFHGDPGYVYTAASFSKIGANNAAKAFRDALALFENSKLPGNIGERLRIFQSIPESTRDEIDCAFWHADDEIWHSLATYVRANKIAFLHLENGERGWRQYEICEPEDRARTFCDPSGVEAIFTTVTGGIGRIRPQPPATILNPFGVKNASTPEVSSALANLREALNLHFTHPRASSLPTLR